MGSRTAAERVPAEKQQEDDVNEEATPVEGLGRHLLGLELDLLALIPVGIHVVVLVHHVVVCGMCALPRSQ